MARGEAVRPLRIGAPPAEFEEALDLEHPLTTLEPLAFVLARMLGDICARLGCHGLATTELRLGLNLEKTDEVEREYRLPTPMRDQRAFLKLMQLDLESHSPGAPILGVRLKAIPTAPRPLQGGLFLPPAPEPEKLELTVARIQRIVGEGNVGVPGLLDTHRPDAFRVLKHHTLTAPGRKQAREAARMLCLRVFRPPLPARVTEAGGRLTRVEAPGVRGKVMCAAGPWRTSGDWWTESSWNRDEYDVTLDSGGVYRLYKDRSWHVEGSYD
jgi:protein ImuB